MSWTDEKVEKLKKLWKKGLTTVEIGKALGISKNAVVGKAHRLQLESRPSPIKKAGEPKVEKPQVKIEVKKEVAKKETVETPVKTPEAKVKKVVLKNNTAEKFVTLMDVTATSCRWPIGDPNEPDFHFCDKEAIEGKPYCLEHCAQAYVGMNKFLKSMKQEG